MRHFWTRLGAALLICAWVSAPRLGHAHAEREVDSPPRSGPVPDPERAHGQTIDVCKGGSPCVAHIQEAVNAASDGALIRIWPGTYREEPSRNAEQLPPDGDGGVYTFEHHVDFPNSQNLIAIAGKKNLTLRGMGKCPLDVVIDVGFSKHVGIRGDRSDGLIVENLSVWHAVDHGVYVLDTDGFRIDRVHSGYSREYPFLFFGTDYGLLESSEAFGGGDAGIYPGGPAETPGRHSMEVRNCKSYNNVLGYSGSNGDHVWVHDSEFFGNAIGFVSDSLTDHPNYPQNNLVFERNLVYDNNLPVYGENANIKPTVFVNSILIPVGVGVFLASGNDNLVQNNHVWGNERYGVWLASGEGMVIGPTSEPFEPPFMSSGNRFIANRMHPPAALPENASSAPNGVDFAWDGMGWGNCWEENVGPDGGAATTDPPVVPPCHDPVLGAPVPLAPPVPWAPNLLEQAGLVFVEDPTNDDQPTPLCKILGLEPCEWEPGQAECPQNLPPGPGCEANPLPQPIECGPEDPEGCVSVCDG